MLLALYSATNDDEPDKSSRYIALSEQQKSEEDSDWVSARKGITIRRGELDTIISALQSADFDAKSDGTGLSDREYLEINNFIT